MTDMESNAELPQRIVRVEELSLRELREMQRMIKVQPTA